MKMEKVHAHLQSESETAEDSFAAEFPCLNDSNSKTNDGFIIPDAVLETLEKNGQKDAILNFFQLVKKTNIPLTMYHSICF